VAAFALCAIVGGAQERHCTVKPAAIPLGQTVRLRCDVEVVEAVLTPYGTGVTSDYRPILRKVAMFKQADGSWEGLMPIAVADPPGQYEIAINDWRVAHSPAVGASGVSAQPPVMVSLTIKKTIFPTQNVTLAPSIEALHSTPEEMKTITGFRDAVSDVKYWEEPLEAPLPGCVISPFGVARLHNGKPTGEFHGGIDQRGALGTPIHAAAAGVVKIVQPFNVLGGTVAIDHGQGLETMYLHMSKLNVAVGDHVAKGAVIGYVGATGRANGPHLHWVVYVNGVPQNPQQWVTGLKSCGAAGATAKKK